VANKTVQSEEKMGTSGKKSSVSFGILRLAFDIVGSSTRWTVALSVLISLVVLRDPFTLAMVIGSVLNAIFGKILKKIIDEERPEVAKGIKESSGMPSSHANSLFFFASFLSLATQSPVDWLPISSWAVVCILFSYATISSLWRVHSGLHTYPQITAGAVLGTFTGSFWFKTLQNQMALLIQSIFGPKIPIAVLVCVTLITSVVLGLFGQLYTGFTKIFPQKTS